MKNVKIQFVILCSAIFALMFVLSTVSVSAAQGNTWTTKASMATARFGLSVSVVDGKIYAIGGSDGLNSFNPVEEYDPKTNTWIPKASMPTARSFHQAVLLDGKIYVIGGHGDDYLNSLEEYDLAANKWITKSSMTVKRTQHKAAIVDGKIYVIGGYNSNGYLNSVEEYDPETNTWTTKASMATARQYHQIAVVDKKIYAIGGCDGKGTEFNSVEEYNPATNTWITKASMATARLEHQIAVVDGKIYVIGGFNDNGCLNSVEEYDPAKNTWTTNASMAVARAHHKTAIVDGKIYVVGGYDNNSYLNSVEEYDLATNTWITKASMATARLYHEIAAVDGKIYAIGGRTNTTLNSLEEYTIDDSKPENLTAIAGNAKVNLSWIASEGAASYNIKRSTVAGDPYTTIATCSAITYTDTTAVNGTTYYYVVSALDSSNVESANSNEVSATPSTPPTPPTPPSTDEMLEVVSVDKSKVGDEITANIVIHNSVNICAEDIKISFDTAKLQFISAEGANGIKIYKEDVLTDGIRRYITASLGKANAANGYKVLLQLKFKAKASGEAKIDITNGRIADNGTLEKDIKEKNCGEKIILIEEKTKDVNRSGEFTLLDLGIDAWYYGETAANTDTSKYDADVVENGTIDDDDLKEIVKQMLVTVIIQQQLKDNVQLKVIELTIRSLLI